MIDDATCDWCGVVPDEPHFPHDDDCDNGDLHRTCTCSGFMCAACCTDPACPSSDISSAVPTVTLPTPPGGGRAPAARTGSRTQEGKSPAPLQRPGA